jgi:hypothetical protein
MAVVRARRFLTAALLAVAACRNEDPAAALVRSLARRASHRDAGAILSALSPSFEGSLGMRREEVGAELARLFAAYASVDVSIADLATERFPEFTLARFVAVFRGSVRRIGGLEGMLPSSARYRFELRLVPEGRELRIATARWEEIAGGGSSRGD